MNKLKRAIRLKGVTLAEVANHLGVSQPLVCKWISDKCHKPVAGKHCMVLCHFLDYKIRAYDLRPDIFDMRYNLAVRARKKNYKG